MGVLLDSSVLIECERLKLTSSQTIQRVLTVTGDTEFGIAAIALTELLHGVYRATDPANRWSRRDFIDELLADIAVFPYLHATAILAGRIGGEQAALGFTIPPIGLMIGVTASSLNYSILTGNLRHFRMIPNLSVLSFQPAPRQANIP
jgi:predicted nucleic acid-binding protein